MKNQSSSNVGVGMFQQGHILTLSGYWSRELADELNHGLMNLKDKLPRNQSEKHISIHLLNYTSELASVTLHLSIIRRIFPERNINVTVVAEGELTGAGILFLAGANIATEGNSRKIFEDTKISMSLADAGCIHSKKVGFLQQDQSPTPHCIEMDLFSLDLKEKLIAGEKLQLTPQDCLQLGLVDKVILRQNRKKG